MTDDPDHDSAAEAFEALRSEVALLRRAIEGLAAERNEAPDYGPTLENLVARQDKVADVLRQVLQSPAVQVTHEAFGASIEQASERVRREDRATIKHAGELLRRTTAELASALEIARTAAAQRDALIWTAVLTMGGTGATLAMAQLVFG